MSGRPLRGDGVASQMRDATANPASSAYRLAVSTVWGKSRMVAVSCGIRGAECERIGAAATADVEQLVSAAESTRLPSTARGRVNRYVEPN